MHDHRQGTPAGYTFYRESLCPGTWTKFPVTARDCKASFVVNAGARASAVDNCCYEFNFVDYQYLKPEKSMTWYCIKDVQHSLSKGCSGSVGNPVRF